MISIKTKKLVDNSSTIRKLFVEGNMLKEKYGEDNIFDFSLGNPSVPTPKEINEAIVDIATNNKNVHAYMNNAGFDHVRGIIADKINKEEGFDLTKENITMTVGAAGGLNIVLNTITNPGDEIILFAPFFTEYTNYINTYDCKQVVISPNIENFQINMEELKSKITPKTKAVFINSPNNPTGVIYSEETIINLTNILKEKEKEYGIDIYLISDEPYKELIYTDVKLPFIPKYYGNTFIIYSYSKSLSLPGERIGYVVTSGRMSQFEDIIGGVNVSNRVLGFVNAPALFQEVVGRCIDVKVDVIPYRENLEILYTGLTEMGYECIKPEGAFYLFVRTPIDDVEFVGIAKKYNLLVVPGSGFACPNHVRISYCTDKKVVENALPIFKKVLEEVNK